MGWFIFAEKLGNTFQMGKKFIVLFSSKIVPKLAQNRQKLAKIDILRTIPKTYHLSQTLTLYF